MFRVFDHDPREFHLQLTSRNLIGDRFEIRERINSYFAQKGPKTTTSRKLAARKPAGERPASPGTVGSILEHSRAACDGAAA
jgi:hypothetical protein